MDPLASDQNPLPSTECKKNAWFWKLLKRLTGKTSSANEGKDDVKMMVQPGRLMRDGTQGAKFRRV